MGVPRDVYDLGKGWEELSTRTEGIRETPRSLGLKDAAQIAFAFADSEDFTADDFYVEFSNVDELYPDEDEMIEK